ncbi:beta-lactamase superfamily domain-domain-containing protein [Coniella lustricola]|uniref:Beta-lactamase superfamily domain-domain-containing protein n=1 Tax=Coniella lustricola TaxID=2025994 RepID=A0A2T3A0M7_9PEZI|nr:beta-lactamase superfamily domain-domain-containing protein [Coniella lustricola]
MATTLDITVTRASGDSQSQPQPRPHHVAPPNPGGGWISYFSGVPDKRRRTTFKQKPKSTSPASFKNPWPSFHKATRQETWQALEWGEDADTAIDLAASHLADRDTSVAGSSSSSRTRQAAQLLQTIKPDFSSDAGVQAKTTWLGHAGVLLELPALRTDSKPVRVIFDPIFSDRSSPFQSVGPIRSYKPPCALADLPPIDVFLISHNHYDHLDYDTVMTLWRLNRDHMRFVVPLKNAQWFTDSGIPADRVVELDWWDSVTLTDTATTTGTSQAGTLTVSCTPAQHSSLRDTYDADTMLWSGWYLKHELPEKRPYSIFFTGDSGYQCHADPAWPPKPPVGTTHKQLRQGTVEKVPNPDEPSPEKYPPCPAYKEIADRLGAPDLVYLPIALGATWAYVRSFFSNYLPPANVPIPRHSAGITGAIHMPPWDAVRVLRDLTASRDPNAKSPVAVAMHWGTFVTEPIEVLKSLGHLEWACYNQNVRFGRCLEDVENVVGKEPVFLALNHGQSIIT